MEKLKVIDVMNSPVEFKMLIGYLGEILGAIKEEYKNKAIVQTIIFAKQRDIDNIDQKIASLNEYFSVATKCINIVYGRQFGWSTVDCKNFRIVELNDKSEEIAEYFIN